MSEDLEVKIRDYESKIADYESRIKATEEQMKEIIKSYPGKSELEVMRIDPWYRGFYYSRLSLLRWLKVYKTKLEELKKKLGAFMYRITFSIDTDVSHGRYTMFVAEITASTIHTKFEAVMYRIVNACLKLFWVVFDSFKDLQMKLVDKRKLIGSETFDKLLSKAIFMQKHATEIDETFIDSFIKDMIKHVGSFGTFRYGSVAIVREPEHYLTHETIIKIGVETLPPAIGVSKYPKVDVEIEKVVPSVFEKKCLLNIAPSTDVDIIKLLGMEVVKK